MAAYAASSDIKPGAPAHDAISRMLERQGFDIAWWRFQTKQSSSAAREVEGGGHKVCPAFTLCFRRSRDLVALGIDPEAGNWRDEWDKTQVIRQELNGILNRENLDADYISPDTFVFVSNSWDEVAFDHLGRMKKAEFAQLIPAVVPPMKRRPDSKGNVAPKHIFWDSARIYHVIFEDLETFQHAQAYRESLVEKAQNIISAADPGNHTDSLKIDVLLHHVGMKDLNLSGLARED